MTGLLPANQQLFPVPMPSAFGWDSAAYPFTAFIASTPFGDRPVGGSSGDQAFLEGHFAANLASSPIYVDQSTGNDTTGNGSSGNKYASIDKAIAVANSAGLDTAHIIVTGGQSNEYSLSTGFNGSGRQPTVKMVVTAVGRVRSSTKYGSITWSGSTDATYTDCYTATQSSGNTFPAFGRLIARRLIDLWSGEPTTVLRLATPSLVNKTPGSWCVDPTGNSGKGVIYYNPLDGVVPTTSNTYLYQATGNLRLSATTPKSFWLRAPTGSDGWDLDGGNTGVINTAYTTTPASRIVLAFDNVVGRFDGTTTGVNNVGVASRGVSIEGVRGIVIMRNCHMGVGGDDRYNYHNALGTDGMYIYHLNCTSAMGGIYDPTAALAGSINGLTAHENVVLVDVCGSYARTMGRSVAMINTTQTLLVGTNAGPSFGDRAYSGGFDPAAYSVANTAKMWQCACRSSGQAGFPMNALADTSQLLVNAAWPIPQADVASGATYGAWSS